MSKSRGSPRKFSEKIALLEKKEAEANAAFERIIKEVEETTRAPLKQNLHQAGRISTSWLDVRQTASEKEQLADSFHLNLRQQQHLGSFNCLDAVEQNSLYLHQRANSFSFSNHDHHQQTDSQGPSSLVIPQQARTAPPYLDASDGRLAQVNVPNIEISAVDDAGSFLPSEQTIDSSSYSTDQLLLHQQQHLHHQSQNQHHLSQDHRHQAQHHHQHHHIDSPNYGNNDECSIAEYGSISAARSLPDIANLRVVGEYSANDSMGPARSEQGIPDGDYNNYDNNCNIVLNDSTSTVLSAQGSYRSLNTSPDLAPRSQRNSLTTTEHPTFMPRLSQSTQGLNTIGNEGLWHMDSFNNHQHSHTLDPQSLYVQGVDYLHDVNQNQQQPLQQQDHNYHNHQSLYYDQTGFDQSAYTDGDFGQTEFPI